MTPSHGSSRGDPSFYVTRDTHFRVEAFDTSKHDRTAFTCGVAAMDRWFKESISDQIKRNRLRVWCAVSDDDDLIGFYGLSAHSVVPQSASALAARRERHPIPAIYLAALATHIAHQGQGLGGALLADALTRSYSVSNDIGAAAVILDVLEDEAHAKRRFFYERIGFMTLDPDHHPNRMYMPMKAVEAQITMLAQPLSS